MDELEFNGRSEVLRLMREEHDGSTFTSAAPLKKSLDDLKEARAAVDDFIIPPRNAARDIDITGWSDAHEAIAAVWDGLDSAIVDQTLPAFASSQGSKRRRIEVLDFLVVRPIFKKYEDEIFGNADHVGQWLWGICGPQGFGKSVFLHCFALKRAFTDLVVWVSACPTQLSGFQLALSTAFYRGCQALQLTGIPYMMKSYTVLESLHIMQKFAHTNGVLLVIIVDQMNRHLEYFDSLKDTLSNFALGTQGAHVILSSSTSGTSEPVFGQSCLNLTAFDHFLSPKEITFLNDLYPDALNLSIIAAGNEWSFLNATRILGGEPTSLEKLASNFAAKLLTQFSTDNANVARLRKSEYMRVLHMVVAKEALQGDLFFDARYVDGDVFFVKKNGTSSTMRVFMEGFAELVLNSIKSSGSYEEYLQLVIGSESFRTSTRGAQGSILEDAVSFLLQNKIHPLRLNLTNLQGTVPFKAVGSILLDNKRYVQSFTSVPSVDDIKWNPGSEWYVGIPPEGCTGIDFILARVRRVGQIDILEVFFIQSTVSTPQDHGILKSTEQSELISRLQKKAKKSKRNTHIYVVFLTPKLGTGSVTANMAYDEPAYRHASFQGLEGNNPLARTVAERCQDVWGVV